MGALEARPFTLLVVHRTPARITWRNSNLSDGWKTNWNRRASRENESCCCCWWPCAKTS
jgi:hypothetical protein